MKNIFQNLTNWFTHGVNSEMTVIDWSAAVVLVLIASFLWARVIRQLAA